MRRSSAGSFLQGLVTGLGLSLLGLLAVLYLPGMAEQPAYRDALSQALDWVGDNLGMSIIPFGLTLLFFLLSLQRLERRLRDGSPLHKVAQADQLTDIWVGLFFGIGVLWTAIGMRSALLYALGDGVETVTGGGAADLLDRLVRGGILTALTTTIVGGAGGYLLRLFKTLKLGDQLKQFYGELDQHRSQRVESLLEQIKDRLEPTNPKKQEQDNAL